jgi:cell division protein FtsB
MKRILRIKPKETTGFLRRHARQTLGLAFLALLLQGIFGTHGYLAMRRTQQEIKQVREQIGKLNSENKSLAGEVNALKTDPKAIERIAREDMGLVRPGELIYKLPGAAPASGSRTPEPQK